MSQSRGSIPQPRRRRTLTTLGAVTATFGLTLSLAPAAAADPGDLDALVKTENILAHMDRLQTIADYNDGNRAYGTDGYEVSMMYVMDQLEQAGYSPERVPFEFEVPIENSDPVLSRVDPDPHDFVAGDDFLTLQYSAAGDLTAAGVPVEPDADDSACSADHFADFPEGAIAIAQRGECDFAVKTQNAADAGASGIVIFNNVDEGPIDGTLSYPADIPSLGATQDVGQELVDNAASGDLTLNLVVDTEIATQTGYNVIAETEGGAKDNVVTLGAHLDSVDNGPGINDNGSGSAAILEIALQLARLDEPNNAVRFAWWDAEELGLHGSEQYVESLSEAERDDIALYLNFDMLASSNYGRFVMDGRNELGGSDVDPAPGSVAIQNMFEEYFDDTELVTEPTALDGRSDYKAFLDHGIPVGGLFSGADGVKTDEQVEWYGGVAGEPYDFYYHTPDDTYENVNVDSLDELSGGVVHAVETYADSTLPVNGRIRSMWEPGDIQWERHGDAWLR